MTIIRVLLNRLGPLSQSAAWALDRSGTGTADVARQPWELDGGSGRCDSGEIGTTAWPPGSSDVRPAKWPYSPSRKGMRS